MPEFRYKVIAFRGCRRSSRGVAGALFSALSQRILATDFGLFLSVEFIAILLIGGAGTTSGTLIGTFFVVMVPQFVEEFTKWLDRAEGGLTELLARVLLTEGDDFGIINTAIQTPGWTLSVFDWNIVLFGALIVVFPNRGTAGNLRHLGSCTQLLEAVAIQLLRFAIEKAAILRQDVGTVSSTPRPTDNLGGNTVKRARWLLAVMCAVALVASACGDDEPDTSAADAAAEAERAAAAEAEAAAAEAERAAAQAEADAAQTAAEEAQAAAEEAAARLADAEAAAAEASAEQQAEAQAALEAAQAEAAAAQAAAEAAQADADAAASEAAAAQEALAVVEGSHSSRHRCGHRVEDDPGRPQHRPDRHLRSAHHQDHRRPPGLLGVGQR